MGGLEGCVTGIYAHIPFCRHRCHYCDFFTIAGRDDAQDRFVNRMIEEWSGVWPVLPMSVRTLFVGGGTPTHLAPPLLERLLNELAEPLRSEGHPLVEFTVEANPDTVDASCAATLARAGVTRVSLGAQSFASAALTALERHHDPENVGQAMTHLRAAGLTDLSLDLIFAVPGQANPLAQWAADLDAALALQPTHLSVYGLTYEPGTPLTKRLAAGRVTRVSSDLEADMYELAIDRLAEAGFEHYEISNWARPGHRCLHNEGYWQNDSWWPLGPSASGHVAGTRWRNVPRLGPYLEGDGLPLIDRLERLDPDGVFGERLMLGLRRLDGIDRAVIDAACSTPLRGPGRRAAIEQGVKRGLVAWRENRLALTRKGLLQADSLIVELL